MGRLVDADFILNKMKTTDAQPFTYSERYAWDFATVLLNNAPTAEAISKSDYEARLKADMVAMLTEIQLEIEEQKYRKLTEDECRFKFGISTASNVIQRKINVLKGEQK